MAEENFQEEEISELFSYSRTLALPIPKEKQPDAPTRKQQPRPNNPSNNRIMERNIKSQKKLEQVRTMYEEAYAGLKPRKCNSVHSSQPSIPRCRLSLAMVRKSVLLQNPNFDGTRRTTSIPGLPSNPR